MPQRAAGASPAPADPAEALRESDEKYRTERDFSNAIVNAAASLLVVLETDGSILRFNRACETLSGYSREEIEGRRFWEVIARGDLEEARRLREAFAGWEGRSFPERYEHHWVLRDGSRRLIAWSLAGVQMGGGRQYIVASGQDITQARRWEQTLAESEERYRSLFEQSVDAVLMTRPDGTVLAANPAACRIFGRTEEEMRQVGRSALVDTSDPRLAEYLRERERTGKARGELTLRRADGSTFAGELSSAIFLDSSGQPKTSMIIRDITERKRAEEALQLSEERFHRAFDDAAIGMALVGLDGRWLRVNRALCQIVGYSEQELLETDFQAITHPDDLGASLVRFRQLLAGEIAAYQAEKRYIHKAGDVIWVLIHVSLIRDSSGRPLYALAQVQDVTARKHAAGTQQLLVEAGAILASSIDYSTTLQNVAKLAVRSLADYCVIDIREEEGQTLRVAGAHRDPAREHLVTALLGYSPELEGTNLIAGVISTGKPVLLAEVPDDLIEAGVTSPEQGRIVRALGPTSAMIVPLHSHAEVLGAMSFMLASPGRRYTERDLSLATDLARRAAMALENAQLYEQAREALASRDALLSVVSHDIRNYLTAIGAFAAVLPDFVPADGSSQSGQLLQGLGQIRGAVMQVNHLVYDLMDFALLQAGRPLTLAQRPVDLVALAGQVIAQQQQTTTKHTLELETSTPHLVGLWDQERLARVLVNLLSNAVKYSPKGGRVLVRLERVQDASGRWAVMSVVDRGVGIPAEDLPHIFSRFTRARNVLHIKGTGLGLFSAQHIVQLHGGAISAESAEGIGSVFTVRLPLSDR